MGANQSPLGEQNVESNVVIWLDTNVNNEMVSLLRRTVNYLKLFSDPNVCVQHIMSITDENIFLIVSGSLGEQIVPVVHQKHELRSIFVFCSNKAYHQQWANKYNKVRGIHTGMNQINSELNDELVIYNYLPAILIPPLCRATVRLSSPSIPAAQTFHLLMKMLTELDFTYDYNRAKQELVAKCRRCYAGNENEIDEFEKSYSAATAPLWYVRKTFMYRMLNKALFSKDIKMLFRLRFFVKDLLSQIELGNRSPVVVYGVQQIESDEIYKYLHCFDTGICVTNTFLVTSLEFDKAVLTLKRPEVKLVLYEIHVDATSNYAQIDANTVLFTLGTIFTIESVEPINHIWKLKLTLSNINRNPRLSDFTDKFDAEIKDAGGILFKLGSSLLDMGEIDKAEWLFHQMIERRTSCSIEELGRMYEYLCKVYESHDDSNKYLQYRKKADLCFPGANLNRLFNDALELARIKRFDEAIIAFHTCLDIQKKYLNMHDPIGGRIFYELSHAYYKSDAHATSIGYFKKWLETQPTDGSVESDNVEGLCLALRDDDLELEYYRIRLGAKRSVFGGRDLDSATTNFKISELLLSQEKYAEALNHAILALEIAEELNDPSRKVYKKEVKKIQKLIELL